MGFGGRLRLLGLIPKEPTSHRHSTKVTWGVHAIADSGVSNIGFDDCRKLLPQRKRQPCPGELTQGKSWGALVSLLCCSSAGRSCGQTHMHSFKTQWRKKVENGLVCVWVFHFKSIYYKEKKKKNITGTTFLNIYFEKCGYVLQNTHLVQWVRR